MVVFSVVHLGEHQRKERTGIRGGGHKLAVYRWPQLHPPKKRGSRPSQRGRPWLQTEAARRISPWPTATPAPPSFSASASTPLRTATPKILTNVPRSFYLSIPVAVIDTSLGGTIRSSSRSVSDVLVFLRQGLWPHGHDGLWGGVNVGWGGGGEGGRKPPLRVVWVVVLRTYLEGKSEDIQAISRRTSIAPTPLIRFTILKPRVIDTDKKTRPNLD
ncbi:hypothetical protein Acr_17g0002760 [Actinidia rufa]|uniref:Uncharacterized protein n=1 Tax=Actinidia rufa TaxID=165716 RepID=A0A7J0G1P0_9ERIC|nr:hypothetical protein Acr_17g0002760 [Actinidia rufa]